MSDLQPPAGHPAEDVPPPPGFNLKLAFALIGLALLAAIGLAIVIVLPFYHRR